MGNELTANTRMAYRSDPSLRFLQHCNNDDLAVLIDILRGKEGSYRFGEGLTSHEGYKRHFPNHKMYWREIAEELQRFGGNSIATAMRGWKGVLYSEIISDVCDKVKPDNHEGQSVAKKEFLLLAKLLERSVEKMSEAERKALLDQLNVTSTNLTGPATIAAIQGLIFAGGFLSYQIAVIVANAVATAMLGQGLRLGANAALTRTIGVFAGPIGWAVTGIWTGIEIAGPSYRVTIASCVQIAYMRSKIGLEIEGKKKNGQFTLN